MPNTRPSPRIAVLVCTVLALAQTLLMGTESTYFLVCFCCTNRNSMHVVSFHGEYKIDDSRFYLTGIKSSIFKIIPTHSVESDISDKFTNAG